MIVVDRLREQMKAQGVSQAELARRIGVSQPTIFRVVHGNTHGSKFLHRIARELGTTAAYLLGDTDDPEEEAPPPPELDSEAREMMDRFTSLTPADRRALLQVARSMADGPSAHGTVQAPLLRYAREGESR